MSETIRIAVVGAGIAGLSTHYFLEREARRLGITARVETWDGDRTPGGNVRTATGNGWQCEEAVESILSSRRETMELALDLGLADGLVWLWRLSALWRRPGPRYAHAQP